MNKNYKPMIAIIAIVSILFIIGFTSAQSGKENTITENNTNEINKVSEAETKRLAEEKKAQEAKKEEARKALEEEDARKAEELKRIEEAKAEQARIEEANRIEQERIQREAEIAEANRLEAERIAEAQRQEEIEASNNFYVTDGNANHDYSTGYDSPYSDPNEPVITEEYGYITSENSYIHKTADCKFIRGQGATQVPVSSSGKPSCNCWYY